MSVATELRKARSCDTTTSVPWNASDVKYSSRYTTAARSRWLVGSSSRRICGSTNNAQAMATRRRQPPDKLEVGWFCMSESKPRPNKILPASVAPLVDSMCASSSCSRTILSTSLPDLSSSAIAARMAAGRPSAPSTHSIGLSSLPSTSCLTSRMLWLYHFMPSSDRELSASSRVDLPAPFRPTRP
mmetsp:Transcript_4268/g.13528  ORF Transcript_4268/g.13528 Transcript_4268/m.13528 type:complete len:186 (+) Transcript_4268:330-887(+)